MFLSNLKNLLAKKSKLLFAIFAFLAVIAVSIGGYMYFDAQKKEIVNNEFFTLLEEKGNNDSQDIATIKDSEKFIRKHEEGVFVVYLQMEQLQSALDSKDIEKASKILSDIKPNTSDKLLNDLIHIQKAKAYIQLKDYVNAKDTLSLVSEKNLEDLQMLLLTELNLESGELTASQKGSYTLNSFLANSKDSSLIVLLKNLSLLVD